MLFRVADTKLIFLDPGPTFQSFRIQGSTLKTGRVKLHNRTAAKTVHFFVNDLFRIRNQIRNAITDPRSPQQVIDLTGIGVMMVFMQMILYQYLHFSNVKQNKHNSLSDGTMAPLLGSTDRTL